MKLRGRVICKRDGIEAMRITTKGGVIYKNTLQSDR
jgi:hypothetical protein